ncbi:hypothetical protein QMA10_13140 [Arthrobacter sp. APC 3897]|uniref:hypothetical protein n=1 Tax=Arthrobacter sp. APC 3897 TaxID=3035204 RepID=UPI0025B4C519|nr:hypothetical protein [Arthrobacter sp. APC 3897]MDN3482867.1 hypothetical protein [Arthrobacter sp. APC 3897]
MDEIELAIKGEIFRISEQTGPDGQTSYHFSWLNGPADGSYGFTVGRVGVGSDSTSAERMPQMTHEQLITEVQGFITAFYEAGGVGEQDFPDHTPAQHRDNNVS